MLAASCAARSCCYLGMVHGLASPCCMQMRYAGVAHGAGKDAEPEGRKDGAMDSGEREGLEEEPLEGDACASVGAGRSADASPISPDDATFDLYDLKVEVVAGDKPFVCSHHVGDSFYVRGENLVFEQDTSFSLYALAAILPMLPAKQRPLQQADWMLSDEYIACPDPNCGARFKITRVGKRTLSHGQTTVVPLAGQ
jgi:uncharacterized repeat protein (TIGR04076 family)